MNELLDQADREICAALLRNGRASWRLIAEVTGLQERTVARRAARLFSLGYVQVSAFAQPGLVGRGAASLARIRCEPRELRNVARWLAHRPESLWVTTVLSESAVVAECFMPADAQAEVVERDLGEFAVRDFSFSPVHRYFRTVRGWHPDILSQEQLDRLGEDESSALHAAESKLPELDRIDLDIIGELFRDGRLGIDAIAATVGVSKTTVRKRIQQLQQSDSLSIRAVIDPALLGFPFEALVTARAPLADLGRIGEGLAADSHFRWVAEATADGAVHALVALRERQDLRHLLLRLDAELGTPDVQFGAEPLLTMYKRSDALLPAAD